MNIDDFDEDNLKARIFLADTSLCHIMGEIAASMLKKSPLIEDQSRITSLLTSWMSSLPEELNLHREDGSRAEYNFALRELYIEYLGTIVLSTTIARKNERQPLCSILSIIAASCMADLYEEVLCRDRVSFLGSIHGFWCMVAALPLLKGIPENAVIESQRKESLDMLCSVLELMRCKFGVAETVARKVSDLNKERQDMLRQHRDEGIDGLEARLGSTTDEQQIARLDSLFVDVRHWYPDLELLLSDPGIERNITPDCDAVENSNHWTLDGLYSVYDVSGASAFADTLFDDIYLADDFGTNLI